MHECKAMQILKIYFKKIKKKMVTKDFGIKHKDHIKKTNLD